MACEDFDRDDHPEADASKTSHKRDKKLFEIRMLLKQHGYQLITTEERLTLLTITSLAKAFTLVAIIIGVGIATGGLSLAEGVALLKSIFITIGSLLLVIVAVCSTLTLSGGLLDIATFLRSGSSGSLTPTHSTLDEPNQLAVYRQYREGEISEATARAMLGGQFDQLEAEHSDPADADGQETPTDPD